MEKIITIELLGETFRFRAEEDGKADPDLIARQLIETVETVGNQFPEHAKKTNKLAIVVLAALNMTTKFVELQDNHNRLLQRVTARADRLDRIIDSAWNLS